VLTGCVVTSEGGLKMIPGAVAIYERDGGLGWLHYDNLTERAESARARELCITNIVTIGNYDYGVNWIFREDGSIQVEAMLTGILLPKGTETQTCSSCDSIAAGTSGEGAGDERYGTLIAPGVVAPNHQHWFNFRLDFDVDGSSNSVLEMNTRSAGPGPANPEGNAFIMSETLLRTEREGARNVSLADHRLWRIVNPSVRSTLGHLSGYELVPGGNGVPYAPDNSGLLQAAGFVKHHVWVTRQSPTELHAAGDYPNQSRGGEGLPTWVSDESVVNTDVVVWYNFAVTHTPRAEEWPVMSTERTGFRLLPKGFFERNPAYQPENALAPHR
ncbi:MAG: nickel transporter, partial [Pyrinomonadaceae bacterium]|nr:nickel transporter [Phycisphaerales bacterium]